MRFDRSLVFLVLVALITSCSSVKDVYRVGEHQWVEDSIAFHVYATADPDSHPSLPTMTLICKSCNLVNPPISLVFDSVGNTRVFIPETAGLLSARLNILGKGIDTTFIQKQRTPGEAERRYKLPQPLIGRVMTSQMSVLYTDSTQDSIASTAQVGDELNLFAERTHFYLVHHPLFREPLWLVKTNAFRLY